MGKKGAGSSGKGQAKSSQEEAPPESEGLKLTGVLSTDLSLLCEQEGLPPISVRPLVSSVSVEESTADTNEGDVPSRYFVMADWEDREDPATLQSLHIRGWLVSSRVMSILTEALTSCMQLTTLNFWNVGLTPDTLEMTVQLTIQHNIRELFLDGNSITTRPIAELMKVKSSLELLSLKCCSLSDSFLKELSPHLTTNKTLLHLDLSCNRLSDDGLCSLATSLRLNRTLLSLSLTNNCIGDVGAAAMAEVLSEFPLNHDEVVMKRKLDSLQGRQDDGMSLTDSGTPQRTPSTMSIDRKGGRSTADKGSKGKKGDAKKEDKSKKDEKGKKGSDLKKSGRGKDSKGSKKGAEPPEESTQPEVTETRSPLVDAKKNGDQWYLPGNTSLVYLTLAYNNINEAGVQHLLTALKYQQSLINPSQPDSPPGLLKLTLHHNSISPTTLAELTELVEQLDPVRTPGPPAAGEEPTVPDNSS